VKLFACVLVVRTSGVTHGGAKIEPAVLQIPRGLETLTGGDSLFGSVELRTAALHHCITCTFVSI